MMAICALVIVLMMQAITTIITNDYEPQPYEYGELSVPFDEGGSHPIKGGAFDPSTGTLYLSLRRADGDAPVIVVYQIQ